MPAEERTESATHRKRQDEREKGNVPKSQDLIAIAAVIVAFYSLKYFGPTIMDSLTQGIQTYFGMAATQTTISAGDITALTIKALATLGICTMPMLLICALVNIVMTMLQTKLLVTSKAFKFKASKLNPLNGLKKMFSLNGLVELAKSAIKLTVVFYIVYEQYVEYIPRFALLMDKDITAAVSLSGEFVMSLINSAAVIFLFVSVVDYFYQRYQYEKNIRMTKQEVKEEYKHTEGDPQIKSQIRQRQRKASMQRMMQEVPTADVIIRNPTHYAIAIRYDADKNRAPTVVAKGADLLAMRIIAIAEQNNITTVENRSLARGLYEAVDINREIPEQYYQGVAEVLAFVYGLRDKAKLKKGN